MHKPFFVFILALLAFNSFGQEKVQWSFSFDNDLNTIQIKADIAEGWHLYSQHIDDEIGPVPTSIDFSENEDVILIGTTEEPESLKEYDENFEGELNFFEDEVVFSQKIDVRKTSKLDGVVTFMVCNHTMCLPPVDKEFSIRIEI